MKISQIFFAIVFIAYSLGMYEMFRVWGFQPKTFLFLTHLTYFFNFYYSFRSFLSEVDILPHPQEHEVFKIGFVFSFVVAAMYWLMYLQDPALIDDKNHTLLWIFNI